MENIYSMTVSKLNDYFLSINEKKYRTEQLYDWLYVKRINDFSSITNMKKEIIEKLKQDFYFDKMEIIEKQSDVDVKKYLLKLSDNNTIEAVLMKHDYGNSLCISSEVGCNMACSFCESGRIKKIRNVTSGEMVLEILKIESDTNTRISHVVIMGIGEPFDNYDNFCDFISIVNNPKGINLGSRHITVSTCGIIPKIYEFANFPYQVNLAISLHAPNDELRSKLMPINKVYSLDKLMPAVKYYIEKTNRRVTFEYIMLKDVNDKISHAKELSNLLKGINCYVNLIPYNETNHLEYKRSDKASILAFYDTLKKNNINVTIRREFGGNIKAACGQLKSIKENLA
ncbi:MAG: 23S rRNA (adenine(2503)-C(2))-methyltransferase RlmN [Erysipelotrichaceae bacterium]|nr:23S rRNA (adenine(2503)-C(2))-methyltransferase RlmN [Erysipelotrichaceae bacterium]